MNAEKFLNQLYKLDELIKIEKEEIEYLKQLVKLSSEKDEITIKIEELEEKTYSEISKYIKLLDKVRETINKVKDVDARLYLKYKYILHYSNEQIVTLMKTSNRSVTRIRNKALESIGELLKDGDIDA